MQKALFLDRDGILNIDTGYTHKPQDLQLIPNIIEFCQRAMQKNFILIVVTNQSGIGRGYYTEEQFFHFMAEMQTRLLKFNIIISGIYFAPFFENSTDQKYRQGKEFRKPNTGMILKAIEDFNINPSRSIMIGDSVTNIQAGLNAKIGRNILYTGGKILDL